MTPEEFTAAVSRTRLQPRMQQVARRVLVDGLSKSEAARETGVTRESARMAVARVEAAHREVRGCPPGWGCLTVCLPLYGEAWQQVVEIAERAKKTRPVRIRK